MIFGTKIPASVTRSDGTGTHTILPVPVTDGTVSVFTVRQFMGEIKQSLQPMMYGSPQLFNSDIGQLRLIFADWPTLTTDVFPVKANDQIHLLDGIYPIAGVKLYEGSHMEIYIKVIPLK